MKITFHSLASPKFFYKIAERSIPWLTLAFLSCFAYGLLGGLYWAPPDAQQGEGFRIIYIHVPSAFLSLLIYSVMAVAAFISLVWRIKLADVIVSESAPLGAWFTFLALWSGAFWGKPMWGTWWIWDARLTSELILLFLYLGFIALYSAIPERRQASQVGNVLVLIGIVNIPIIHYSVYWWNTLHQGATLNYLFRPLISLTMLYPLLAMIGAFIFYYLAILLLRIQNELLWRERKSSWVNEIIRGEKK